MYYVQCIQIVQHTLEQVYHKDMDVCYVYCQNNKALQWIELRLSL